MSMTHLTDETFQEEVIAENAPVLVDFWADWCPPCKMIAPTLEEIAQQQTDVKICKIDVVENPKTMENYDVKGLPSLILFHNGEVVGRKVGALSKAQILDFIDQCLTELNEKN